jgi:dTDP-glucose pyrophosphorylase/CBS domain-containing protein
MVDLAKHVMPPTAPIREVMKCIDRNGKGIALVVDHEQRLIGTITDGDIRRAILAGINLDSPIMVLLEQQTPESYPTPVKALAGTPDNQLLRRMSQYAIRHIPLVDEADRVVDIAILSDIVREYELPLTAVVMAGGFGTRLRPLTENTPKPMLLVGDRPLLELIIENLHQAGIRRINLTTHYKKDIVSDHFGDGRDFGVAIEYVEEDQPLGTAGALGLIDSSNEPLLVINGDVLTQIDFRAMLDFHREQRAAMTVAVREHEFPVPYGVVEIEGAMITGISEKPVLRHFINAGIYLLQPEICRLIPQDQHYDMPDLISHLIAEDHRVISFPISEYWLDIGQPNEYRQANTDVESGTFSSGENTRGNKEEQ